MAKNRMVKIFVYSFAATRQVEIEDEIQEIHEHNVGAYLNDDEDEAEEMAKSVCASFYPEIRGYYNHTIALIELPPAMIGVLLHHLARYN